MSSTKAAVAAAPAADTRATRLHDKGFGVASFKFNRWSCELDVNQTLDDALRPEFWANVAGKIVGHDQANPKGIGDIIEIRKRDTALFAEVIIVAIGAGHVRVAPLRAFVPPDVSEPEGAPLTTRYNIGRRCHEVIRKDDKTVMASGFQLKEDAVGWINTHLKAMAA